VTVDTVENTHTVVPISKVPLSLLRCTNFINAGEKLKDIFQASSGRKTTTAKIELENK